MSRRITQSEGEAKETWKPMNRAGQDDVRNGPYSKLPYGAGELVRTCRQITKVRHSLACLIMGYVLIFVDDG